jgi:hypothetical protein
VANRLRPSSQPDRANKRLADETDRAIRRLRFPHKNEPGGKLHALATEKTAGFMSPQDKEKLDGIAGGAAGLCDDPPASVQVQTGDPGTSPRASRCDHRHAIATGSAVELTDSTNSEGASSSLARANHTHAHGARGGGTLHALATPALAGFMSATDKDKLDGIAGGAAALCNDPATTVQVQTAAAGTSTEAARCDHVHSVSTASAVAVTAGGSNGAGTATSLARSDHTHAAAVAAPTTISDSTNSAGTASTFVRSDHVHAHGNRGGGSLHALATGAAHGFMASTDKSKLDGIEAGATADAPYNATPEEVGTTGAAGTSDLYSRGDHVHAHGDQAGGSLHALATDIVAGFMSPADKAKLDGFAGGGDYLRRDGTTTLTGAWNAGAHAVTLGSTLSVTNALTVGGASAVGTNGIASTGTWVLNQNTDTDSTNKLSLWGSRAFVNAQPPVIVANTTATSTANIVRFGGGSGSGQAATQLDFFIASAVNTTSGAVQWRINSDGHLLSVNAGRNIASSGTRFGTAFGTTADFSGNGTFGGTLTVTSHGTFGGNVVASGASSAFAVGDGTASPTFVIRKGSASNADIFDVRSGGTGGTALRWRQRVQGASTNIDLPRYDATGTFVDFVTRADWANGTFTVFNDLSLPGTGADGDGSLTMAGDLDVAGTITGGSTVTTPAGSANGFRSGALKMYGFGAEDAYISSELDEHIFLDGFGDPKMVVNSRAIIHGTLHVRTQGGGGGFGPGVERLTHEDVHTATSAGQVTIITLATLDTNGRNVKIAAHVVGSNAANDGQIMTIASELTAYRASGTVSLLDIRTNAQTAGAPGFAFDVVVDGNDVLLVFPTLDSGTVDVRVALWVDRQYGGFAS